KTIKARPDEVKRIIRALQLGKKAMLKSRERTLDLITGVLKMDKETAADTYKAVEATFNDSGIPTREGMNNIIKAIKAEGRFMDRNIAYEEVADPRFAIEVANELGYKVSGNELVIGVLECRSDTCSGRAAPNPSSLQM